MEPTEDKSLSQNHVCIFQILHLLSLITNKGGEVPLNSPIHHREISTGELNKTQLNFHDREILVARRVVLN